MTNPDRKTVHKYVDELLDNIVPDADAGKRSLMHQLLYSASRVAQDDPSSLNLKMMTRSLRELRRGFNAFAPYSDKRKVAIFGSARTKPGTPDYEMAVNCARGLVEEGWMIVTGAGPGIMEAANKGAGRENSFGVNIVLPFEQSANEFIEGDKKLVNFRYFFTRKVVFVKETDAVVLFPGGFGTHDEGFETLTLIQTGKCEPRPVVMIEEPGGTYWSDWHKYVKTSLLDRGLISAADVDLYKIVYDPQEAIEYIERFYRNFHSIRYIDGRLIVRLQHAPTELLMEKLNAEYKDILVSGRIEVCGVHAVEADEPELADLHRLKLHFNQRHLGRLRKMIETLSAAVTPEQARTGLFPPSHHLSPMPENGEEADNGDED